MGKLRWYKRDPVAALEGMSNLTLEERGAYNTVLDLIYARDGKVDDDDRFIAGWLRCDVRVWKRIRARLLDLKKLYALDGALHNSRADAEVDEALCRVGTLSELNKTKGIKSGEARRKNKELAEPNTEPGTNTTTTTSREELSLRESRRTRENVLRETKPKRAKARTQIADDWCPNEAETAHAVSLGFQPDQIAVMAASFKNHHIAKGNLMADWSAAWRTWCGNEIKFQRSNGNGQGRFRSFQNDELSVSRALERQTGVVTFAPRPRLLPDDGKDDLRLLSAGRSAES